MTANSGVSLSVPATSRERRDSTKYHIAYGTIVLRNIDGYGIKTRLIFLNPSVSHSSTAPLYCSATQRSNRLPFLPTHAVEPLLRVSERNALAVEPQRLWLVPLWGKYVCNGVTFSAPANEVR